MVKLPIIPMVKPQPSQYEAIKNKVVNGRCTVNDLRNEIRKDFKNRIHTFRNKQVDARRHALDKNTVSRIIKEGFSELQASLLIDKDAVALLEVDTVLNMLGEVQEELLREELQLEGDAHEENTLRETNAIVENLLTMCSVCEKFVDGLSEANVICQDCASACFNNINM